LEGGVIHISDIFVLLFGGFCVWRLVRSRQRRRQVVPGAFTQRDDVPARLLGWAVGLLATERADWGQAMIGELDHIDARAKRWRFTVGCVGAALLLPPWGRAAAMVGAFAAAAAGCVGLYAYALIRYPGLDSYGAAWVFLAIMLVVLVGYTLAGSVLVRRPGVIGRGLVGGLFILVAWLVLDGVTGPPNVAPAAPLLMFVVPLLVGAGGAWHGGSAVIGRRIALLAGLCASLGLFLIGAVAVIATGAGPYTPGQITEAGTTDVTTYVVSDGLGNGVILMLAIPLVTAMIGWAGAVLTTAYLRRSASPPPPHPHW
jgi:hypothetical protein